MNEREKVEAKNIHNPIKKVKHSLLERAGDSNYTSICSECKIGVLVVRRNEKKNFIIEEYDRCLLCGQAFEYEDIDELREMDWAS